MLELTLNTEKEFFELRDEWEALLAETEDLDFFSTWEWNYSWWKNFKENKQLFLLTIRDGENRLVGIFPGCILKYTHLGVLPIRVLQFIGRGIERNSIGEYSDFLDVIVHRKFKTEIHESLLSYLRSQKKLCDLIYLKGLKETSGFFQYLKTNINSSFILNRIENGHKVYLAVLPNSMDEYLKNLSSSFRGSLRRKVRKWESNYGEKLCTADDIESREDFFVNFFDLVRERHNKVVSNERQIFHRDVANYSSKKNRFWGIFTKVNDQYSAVAVVYLFNGGGYFYQHAINPQFSKDSPGMVLLYFMVKKIIQNGISRLDFLQGEYDYKKKFGKDFLCLFNVYLGNGTLRSKVYLITYSHIEKMKTLVKKIVGRKVSNCSD